MKTLSLLPGLTYLLDDRVSLVSGCPNSRNYKKKPPALAGGDGGAGGIRTLVQTRNRSAFYMLSSLSVVGKEQGMSTQL